jgi:hypothetical protein
MMSLNTSTHTLFNIQEIRHCDNRKLVPHVPRSECEHEDITVLWKERMQTDREVLSDRTDIIIKSNKDKICVFVDVAIPSDRKVTQKEAGKKLKYRNFSIGIQ